jgi:putative ABC transport system permease protein
MLRQSGTLAVAFDSLRCNKLRVLLAVVGVMVGSACIILVVTVSLTERRYVMEQIEAIGSNIVYADHDWDPRHPLAMSDNISLADLEAVKNNIPEVAEAAGTRQMPVVAQLGGNDVLATLAGVTRGYQEIRKLIILQGRYFDESDFSSRSRVCLITAKLEKRISPAENPVGKSIRVGEERFTIVGVFTERVSSYGMNEIQRESILVPFEVMKSLTGDDKVWLLYVQARTPDDVPTVTQTVSTLLKSRHPGPATYRVQNLDAILKVADHIAFALSSVMLIVAIIAMVSSGVGIMNIMLASVIERTPEIGIRRAFGARRTHILSQFLIEALVISLAGALAGIGVGVFLPLVVRPMLSDVALNLEFSWVAPLLAILVSCLFGLFFGYLPASRAARIEPYEALRYE